MDAKVVVREYLDRIGRGDPRFEELLADEIEWWVPPGSHAGGTYRGKTEVLGLIRGGSVKYAPGEPLSFSVERIVAEGEWVCVQTVLEARTAHGRDYRNHFHLAFQVRGGRIILAREHLDTQYANDAFEERASHG
jgi:ketosteroid isomerase-like protein